MLTEKIVQDRIRTPQSAWRKVKPFLGGRFRKSSSWPTVPHRHLMLDRPPRQIDKVQRRPRTETSHIVRSAHALDPTLEFWRQIPQEQEA
jgi:hypothetical protein